MKPILFNTEMVKAILGGIKTVTRRIIKPQPDKKHCYPLGYVNSSTDSKNIGCFGWGIDEYGGNIHYAKPPYQVGDIIYVRETWTPYCINKKTCSNLLLSHANYCYKASPKECVDSLGCKWHPSIHMPKEVARIFLKVTDVRVERLQNITSDDAVSEGSLLFKKYTNTIIRNTEGTIPRTQFMLLWNSTIKKEQIEQYSWEANPYVWVIEFERCEK